jgi:hypothetical protein
VDEAKQVLVEYFATPGNIKYEDFIMATGKGITKLVCEHVDLPEYKQIQL